MKNMCKLFTITVATVIAMCALTLTAMAAPLSGGPDSYSGTWTALTADSSAISYRNGNAYVYLSEDINLSTDITVSAGQTLHLHLNDKVLTGTGRGSVITVKNGGALHIYDVEDADGTVRTSVYGYDIYAPDELIGYEPQDISSNAVFTGGYITGGRAQNGGAVYIDGGEVTLHKGTIINNAASESGGGVYVGSGATFNLKDGSITHNTAEKGGVFVAEGGLINAEDSPYINKNYMPIKSGGNTIFTDQVSFLFDCNLYLSEGTTIHLTDIAVNAIDSIIIDVGIVVTTERTPTEDAPIIIARTTNLNTNSTGEIITGLSLDDPYEGNIVLDETTGTVTLEASDKAYLTADGSAIAYELYTYTPTVAEPTHPDDGRNVATVYLNKDISLTTDIVVENNETLYLNLDSHILTGTGRGPVITVNAGGRLVVDDVASIGTTNHHYDEITDKIYEGYSPVYEYEFGGGAITGGHAEYGGGIYVAGELVMKNGAVIDNSASINGGGIYVTATGTFSLDKSDEEDSGARVIGNTVSGEANNVYLPSGKTIEILGVLTEDSYGVRGTYIGVTMEDTPTVASNVQVTTNMVYSTALVADFTDFFYSDNGHDMLVVEQITVGADTKPEVMLQAPRPTIDLSFSYTGGWNILQSSNTFATGNNYYFLNEDVTLTTDIVVANGEVLHLHLNDNTLTGTGTGSVITVENGGTLHVYSATVREGLITGGNADNGGGINIKDGGAVTLYGGTISGNTATDGGGVYVGGALTVQGNPRILGNTEGGTESTNNVYLPNGKSIVLETSTSGAAKLGVTTQTAPTNSASVTIATGEATHALAYFASDNMRYGLALNAANTELSLTNTPPQAVPTDAIQPENGLIGGEQWRELTAGGTLTSGYYYLSSDLVLEADLTIARGATVYLHLNDKILKGTGTASAITSYGTFYLYDIIDGTQRHWDTQTESILPGMGDADDYPFTGGVITGGNTSSNGGGIYISTNNESAMYGGNIVGNRAGGLGGGMVLWGSPDFIVKGGSFIANTSGNNGGGIAFQSSGDGTVENVSILGNTAGTHGGAVYVNSDDINIVRSTLAHNKAETWGGAVFINAFVSARLEYVTADSNTAKDGGGLFISDLANAHVEHSTFTNNSVVNEGGGIIARGEIALVDTVISGNSAKIGGGLSIFKPTNSSVVRTYMEDCTITGNTAEEMGGGTFYPGQSHDTMIKMINMRGKIVIMGNKLTDGRESDMFLPRYDFFHIYGIPESGTQIGVFPGITPVNDALFIVTESDASLLNYMYANNNSGSFSYRNGAVIMTEYVAPVEGGGTATEEPLTVERLNELAESDIESLTVDSAEGSIEFDKTALQEIAKTATEIASSEDDIVTIVIEKIADNTTGLTTQQLAVAGESPVYALYIEVNGKRITSFGTGKATVTVPEISERMFVYYMDAEGALEAEEGRYDSVNSTQSFVARHLSRYLFSTEMLSATLPFTDVTAEDWHYTAVQYAFQTGIMSGMSDTLFMPDGNMTRAMVWTVLARMSGVDTAGGDPWYSVAQDWAMENEVSDGTNPDGNITREELVTMLYRYAGSPTVEGALDYPDEDEVSDWAYDALIWAVDTGIIEGIDGKLTPQGETTRAQVATMLMRYLG